MPDSIMYSSDGYVVLEPNQPEQFLSSEELLEKLKMVLAQHQDELPRDLQQFTDLSEQARHLLETSCELTLDPGQFLQWYAVRFEK